MERLRILLHEYIEIYGVGSQEVLEVSEKLDVIVSRLQKDINKYEEGYSK